MKEAVRSFARFVLVSLNREYFCMIHSSIERWDGERKKVPA
jgi:hypothetical protein